MQADTSKNQTKSPSEQNERKISDFNSQHTTSLPLILEKIKSSLLITTYQSGRVIVARPESTDILNTHFTLLNKPMGLATDHNRFALGVRNEIIEYQNIPNTARKVDKNQPASRPHDSCYVPRYRDITGDIDIHEMAYDTQGQLWFINTRFSCLCTPSQNYSFEPQWKPWFVDSYTPEDRCHLNGLAMRDGQPKYATALGQTNTPGGWRENKRDGGILIDIQNNTILCEGLSMPHSPRWHNNKLYLLESGYGSLVEIDPETGDKSTLIELPGFTRGLSIIGNLAFIGLSKVRESNTFGGLPLTESEEERHCGVWAVDLSNYNVIGFLRFSGDVEEIFAVEVLPQHQFPALLDLGDKLINTTYVLSEEVLKQVDFSIFEKNQGAPESS